MPAQLSRRQIVDAAIAFIDANGLEKLTMRRLGSELSVEAMALYRYVSSREELLGLCLETLVDDLFEEPNLAEQANSWQEYLTCVADHMRALAIKHPRIFPLLCTKPTVAPWIRPPLRSLRWVEHFLESLKHFGFSEEQSVDSYKSFTSFLIGFLLLEAAAHSEPSHGEGMAAALGQEDLDEFPLVLQYRPLLEQDVDERDFHDGVDELLERIRVQVPAPRTGNEAPGKN